MMKMLFGLLVLMFTAGCFAGEVDMSQFTCATITAKAKIAMEPDIPYLNEILKREYVTAIDNWKKNKDAGHPYAIPDPPIEYVLAVSYEKCGAWIERGTKPVMERYVEPVPEPPPSKAGVITPPFLPGRYLCVMGDNAPEGYIITLANGIKVKKIINMSPFGPMPEYDEVK